jgi:predicted dehydrogenase
MQRRTLLFTAASAARVLGANDRIRVGIIGCGGRALHVARHMRKAGGVDYVAVCDVYGTHTDRAREFAGGDAKTFGDFRRLLEQKDIDAVLIGTPDHWHAIPAVLAIEADKHVYVEKPLAHNIKEGRAIVDAAKKTRRIVQAGTQQRSATHFPECADMVQSGKLGDVRLVRVWNYMNIYPRGIGQAGDSEPPPGVDWDFYLGPAPYHAFNRLRFVRTYRFFFDYAGGLVTDFGTHRFDTVHQIIGKDTPKSAHAMGGRLSLDDGGDTPDSMLASFEYPGFILSYEGYFLNSHGTGGRTPGLRYYRASGSENRPNGMAFYGTSGTLIADRYSYEVYPEPGSALERRTVQSYDATDLHTKNFVEAIRGLAKPAAPVEGGHRATTVAHLANISLRTGHKILWDATREECKDDPEANRLLGRNARKPWDMLGCPDCAT